MKEDNVEVWLKYLSSVTSRDITDTHTSGQRDVSVEILFNENTYDECRKKRYEILKTSGKKSQQFNFKIENYY